MKALSICTGLNQTRAPQQSPERVLAQVRDGLVGNKGPTPSPLSAISNYPSIRIDGYSFLTFRILALIVLLRRIICAFGRVVARAVHLCPGAIKSVNIELAIPIGCVL